MLFSNNDFGHVFIAGNQSGKIVSLDFTQSEEENELLGKGLLLDLKEMLT